MLIFQGVNVLEGTNCQQIVFVHSLYCSELVQIRLLSEGLFQNSGTSNDRKGIYPNNDKLYITAGVPIVLGTPLFWITPIEPNWFPAIEPNRKSIT